MDSAFWMSLKRAFLSAGSSAPARRKVAQRVIDDLLLRGRKRGVFRRSGDGLVAGIEPLVLGEFGVVVAQARQVLVVGGAQASLLSTPFRCDTGDHRRASRSFMSSIGCAKLSQVQGFADASTCSSAWRFSASNRSSAGVTCSGRMAAKRGRPEGEREIEQRVVHGMGVRYNASNARPIYHGSGPAGIRPPMTSHPYDALTPEVILDAVETFGVRATARCSRSTAMKNRVYRVDTEDDGTCW